MSAADPADARLGRGGEAASPPAPEHFAAARLDQLPPGTLLGVTAPDGTAICLANVDGAICAVRDVCTHQAFPLSAGDLLPDGTIQCAWHGARFDARTGAACSGPVADPVQAYEVRVEAGVIRVGPPLPDVAGGAAGA